MKLQLSEQLETTRDTFLEESTRVILLAHSLKLGLVCVPISRDHILLTMCIVEIPVRMIEPSSLGRSVYRGHQTACCVVDLVVVGRIGEDWGNVGDSKPLGFRINSQNI